MKKIFLAVALASVSACAAIPTSPAVVANATVLDEQGAIGVELAYKAARTALELAVDSGLLKGERAALAARLDNQAFAAVGVVRAAYKAGNASDYATALFTAQKAIAALLAVLK